jgi:hypothetical protein
MSRMSVRLRPRVLLMEMRTTARIHLLPAKEARYVVVLRRKPSKTYHVIRWNIETDQFEHGSWFTGHIYVLRTDVSFDGKWMVYLARGARGNTWNGVCLLPHLKTYLEADAPDTWGGGGYWKDERTLITDSWLTAKGTVPFRVEDGTGREDVYVERMKRDGWTLDGQHKRWSWQFHQGGVTLEAKYGRHTADLKFSLPDHPGLLDREVEWATFASNADLIFTRRGWVYRFSREDLGRGEPGFAADLNELVR